MVRAAGGSKSCGGETRQSTMPSLQNSAVPARCVPATPVCLRTSRLRSTTCCCLLVPSTEHGNIIPSPYTISVYSLPRIRKLMGWRGVRNWGTGSPLARRHTHWFLVGKKGKILQALHRNYVPLFPTFPYYEPNKNKESRSSANTSLDLI